MIKASDRIAIISGERNISFTEMLKSINLFAAHSPKEKGEKTLILSENREGWIYALYAVWANQGIVVPVDASSTAHDIAYIINDCHPKAVWVSQGKLDLLKQALEEASQEIDILLIDDLEQKQASQLEPATIPYPMEATCLICYTSGTTGSPKGVMLSFRNVIANVNAVWKEVPIFDSELRTLVLLPLHHVLPLVGCAVIPMIAGGGVAICPSLAAADIMQTLQRGRIGIMIGVPRLWQTLFRGIKGKIDASAVTRMLYALCEKVQSRTLSRLIFKSVRTKMGGMIKYCVAGGAALDSDTASGLKTLGLDVLEGYGMTEAAPMITFTRPDDIRPGCVGLPIPSVEVKLVDGELCARGENVMQGYYNRPEETADIIDKDGFLHTGDLATIDEAGRVTITGRKKEIIVLSNGKNVNPSEIEEKLEHYTTMVKEAAVTQDGDLLKAIIVPEPAWCAGKSEADIEETLKREVLQNYNTTVAPYKKLMSLFVFHGDLPRTRLEKLQRFKLKDIIQGNATATPDANSVEEAQEEVSEEFKIIRDYISREKQLPVRPTDNLETDLAMDSLDKVALQGFIEQTFGLKMTAEQLLSFADVQALANHITQTKTQTKVENIDWHKILTHQSGQHKMRIPRMAWTGFAFTSFCKWLYGWMFKLDIKGLENLPQKGPYILAPNHQSFLDAPLVVCHLSKRQLCNTYFYAKRDHVKSPLRRWLASRHNIIIMDMSTLKDSIQMLGEVLGNGKNLVIFPEGSRTRNGKIGPFKKTFAILSKELQIPVIPVKIDGAYEAWPRHKKLPRRHKVTATYLPAITPLQDETYEQLMERVRGALTMND